MLNSVNYHYTEKNPACIACKQDLSEAFCNCAAGTVLCPREFALYVKKDHGCNSLQRWPLFVR